MIKINNEEVIFSECILIDGLAETWVTIPHKNDPIKMCIAFEEIVDKTAKKEDSSFVKVEGKKDHARIVLTNWSGPLGGVAGPFNIGTTEDKKKINVMIDCMKSKTVAKVILQVMLGRNNEQA